jgi:hypothetical protein
LRSVKADKEKPLELWIVEAAREMLKAQGRLMELDFETADKRELRTIVENVSRTRRMREVSFSITKEPGSGLSGETIGAGVRRLIWNEVN